MRTATKVAILAAGLAAAVIFALARDMRPATRRGVRSWISAWATSIGTANTALSKNAYRMSLLAIAAFAI